MVVAGEPFARGVLPVIETPFRPDGEVDLGGFVNVVDHVASTGATALAFPGFASEFHKLSGDEREMLVATMLERLSANPATGAVISVADHATVVAVRAAEKAVSAGASAVNIMPPHFLAPSPSAVQAHLRAVLKAVAPVPVIVQYSPALTGLSLGVAQFAELAEQYPNFRTVKVESTPPGPMVTALAGCQPAIASLVGYGGLHLIDALRRGAAGVQPGCSFTEIYVAIWQAWGRGDFEVAESLHRRLLPYVTYWMQGVELIVQAEKTISMRRGLISSDHCRSPGRSLDSYELATIDRFLTEFEDLLAPPQARRQQA